MTLTIYARTKEWDLGEVTVAVDYDHQSTPRRFDIDVQFTADLDQRATRAARKGRGGVPGPAVDRERDRVRRAPRMRARRRASADSPHDRVQARDRRDCPPGLSRDRRRVPPRLLRLPLGEATQAGRRRPDLERSHTRDSQPSRAPIAHIGLHVSAVAHSYDTGTFLPPHTATAAPARSAARPELQRILDALVTGPGSNRARRDRLRELPRRGPGVARPGSPTSAPARR